MSTAATDGRLTHTIKKNLFTTSNPFEKRFGYHRAVRRGPIVAVSGTTALKLVNSDESPARDTILNDVEYPDNALMQANISMDRCIKALTALGGKIEDVVRIRMFVGRADDCDAVGEAFRQHFVTVDGQKYEEDVLGVAATMIVVPGGFVNGGILVEVELDAYCL